MKGATTLVTITDLETVFERARQGQKRMDFEGVPNVSIRRMECFAVKGTACVYCGIKGDVITISRWKAGDVHLDLFHTRPDGNRTLMNVDHIKPKWLGGPDELSNYQPTCEPCNSKKGGKENWSRKPLTSSPILVAS